MDNIFKRLTLVSLLASVPILGGCGDDIISWQEEVQLLDGRVIMVTQKRRIDIDSMPREAWLSLKLPEFGDQEIVWHENLNAIILNVFQNKLFLVGIPGTIIEYRQYGKPEPYYLGYRYENAKWVRIPFSDIPEPIYEANLYPENMALARLKKVTIPDKTELFKDDAWRPHQRKIEPNYISNFRNL